MSQKSTSDSKVWQLLADLKNKKGITEIVINNSNSILAEKDGRFFQLDAQITKKDIFQFVSDVSTHNGLPCNQENPLFDGVLPGGERINIVHPPIVFDIPAITIRPFDYHVKRFDDHPQIFGLDTFWLKFIKALLIGKSNFIISGGTGIGKTTFINLLLHEIPSSQRIITIEDTRELQSPHPNIVHLEAKNRQPLHITARDLVKNALRMRPDRLIIGEIRGDEVFDLLQAMNTGHSGSISSIHANSPVECLTRLATLYMMTGIDIPIKTIKTQIATSIQFIIQLSRHNGERRISEIMEITGIESDNISTQKIAILKNNQLTFSGIVPRNMEILIRGGLTYDYFK